MAKYTTYRDRSPGLVIAGALLIFIGACCALLVPLTAIAVWVSALSSAAGESLQSTVPVMAFNAVLAAIFAWLGIGLLRARRWARDLVLSLAWIWLVTGVSTLVVAWLVLPALVQGMLGAAGVPPVLATAVTFAVIVFLVLTQVALPGGLLLFLRTPDVAATCHARDPRPQFTDSCPERVLTLAVVWAVCAFSVLVVPAYDFAFPLFGVLLRGTAGILPWAMVFAICTVLAWGSCRRTWWAWWGGVAAVAAAALTTILTTLAAGPAEMVRALQPATTRPEVWASLPTPPVWAVVLAWLAVWGSFLAYLQTVRRFFVKGGPATRA